MPLDPIIAARLADAAAQNLPALRTLSPEAARAEAKRRVRAPGKAVAEIRDIRPDGFGALSLGAGGAGAGGSGAGGAGPEGSGPDGSAAGAGGSALKGVGAAGALPPPPVPIRLYRPHGLPEGPAPVVIYVHGGGFVICDLDTHDGVARTIAADAGAIVLSVDYRLAPEHPFPTAVDDVLAAVHWAAAAAPGFGGDPARMAIAGDSAGGNLATVACLRLRDAGGPRLAAQLLIYPVTDHPAAGHASYTEFAEGFGLTAADMAWFFAHYIPDPAAHTHPDAAPLRAASLRGLPPAYVLTAEHDVLRDEAERYAERLAAEGVAVVLRRVAGINHGSIELVGVVDAVTEAHEGMMGWLRGNSSSLYMCPPTQSTLL